jgi:hypothetical protein
MAMSAEFSPGDIHLDADKLQNRVDRGTDQALHTVGENVRQSARSSLRVSQQISSPGQPPSIHSRDPRRSLLNIQFAVEEEEPKRVYIGPIALASRSTGYRGRQTVPELLEQGGSVTVQLRSGRREKGSNLSDLRLRLLQRSGRLTGVQRELSRMQDNNLRSVVYNYQARPFMGPALERERRSGAMLAAFRDTVHE